MTPVNFNGVMKSRKVELGFPPVLASEPALLLHERCARYTLEMVTLEALSPSLLVTTQAQEQAMDDMRAAKGKPSLKDLSHLTLQPMVFEEEDGTEYRTVLGMSPPFDPRFPNQNQTK